MRISIDGQTDRGEGTERVLAELRVDGAVRGHLDMPFLEYLQLCTFLIAGAALTPDVAARADLDGKRLCEVVVGTAGGRRR